jgi:hypothetical protein
VPLNEPDSGLFSRSSGILERPLSWTCPLKRESNPQDDGYEHEVEIVRSATHLLS